MRLNVTRADVWAASIEDRPGALAVKLAALAEAGADLEFVLARGAPELSKTGAVLVTPIKGAAQVRAAKAAGFTRTTSLHSLRVEGADKPGTGAGMTQQLAAAGINLRGVSAAVIGRRFLAHFALDSAAAATKAMRILKRIS